MKANVLIGMLAWAVQAAVPAAAHHSFAMFDGTKQVDIEGTIKDFQWTNPHIWIQVMVPDGKGGANEYSVEGVNVSAMRNLGWSRHSLKPGDKVKISMRPMRNGNMGGSLMSATLADGTKLSGGAPQTIGGGAPANAGSTPAQ